MIPDTRLLDVSEALGLLLDHFSPLETTHIPLAAAVGRILAEDIHAPNDMPLFPNSSMDGFACRAADVSKASRDKACEFACGWRYPGWRCEWTGSFFPVRRCA